MTTHHETKPGFLTTEFLATIAGLIAVVLGADWQAVAALVAPYALSRGLAKVNVPQTFTEHRIDPEDQAAYAAGEIGAAGGKLGASASGLREAG